MKNLMKLAPLVLVVLAMSACGGGGGTADPDAIAQGVVDAIKGENFPGVYNFLPDHQKKIMEGRAAHGQWRLKEGWERWKDFKPMFEGDNGLDPKDKSEITGGQEKWEGASDAQRFAALTGLYRMYTVDDWEKRLKDGNWLIASRRVELDIEGQGKATIRYQNEYEDTITVTCARENGLWYLAGVDHKMEKKLPDKPKD